jgi:hypothetical protein
MKQIFMPLLSLVLLASACIKKVDTCPAGPESPLPGFLAKTTFDAGNPLRQTSVPTDEMGYKFKVLKNGIITGFSVKIPNVDDEVPVTLWDGNSNMAIKTMLVNVTASDFTTKVSFSPISVSAGSIYYISMNANNYFSYSNFNQGTSYPISTCNIEVLSAVTAPGFGTKFPGSNLGVNKFYGDVDIIFEAQ